MPEAEAVSLSEARQSGLKILVYASAFLPSIGGLELMTKMLAEEFATSGHQVTVVTKTPGQDDLNLRFHVVRNPSPWLLVKLTWAADVLLHMNLNLKGLWPLTVAWRPLVIGHYGQYRRLNGQRGLRDDLKYCVSNWAINIACSKAVKSDLPLRTPVIGNAYEDEMFRILPGERSRDFVFVGRLVSEKGVDLLLEGIVALRERGSRPSLTIVGMGPAEQELRHYCNDRRLNDQVTFAGKLIGDELVALINRHRVMVVPSRNEGFGIVALEGIACGCIVVGSDAGGLPEAVGECGVVFKNGDVPDLVENLLRALSDDGVWKRFAASRNAHLARFTRRRVAEQYLNVIETAVTRAQAH